MVRICSLTKNRTHYTLKRYLCRPQMKTGKSRKTAVLCLLTFTVFLTINQLTFFSIKIGRTAESETLSTTADLETEYSKPKLQNKPSFYTAESVHLHPLDTDDSERKIDVAKETTQKRKFTTVTHKGTKLNTVLVPPGTEHCSRNSSYYAPYLYASSPDISTVLQNTLDYLYSLYDKESDSGVQYDILPNLCRLPTHLLFILFSEFTDSHLRARIRQSWASVEYYNFDPPPQDDGLEDGVSRVDYLFVVTFPATNKFTRKQFDDLKSEMQAEKDILPMRIASTIKNITTLRYLLASQYVLRECANKLHFVTFLNQSVMPNVPLLGSFISSQRSHPKGELLPMYCLSIEGAKPIRPTKGKKGLNNPLALTLEEWKGKTLPKYCDIRRGGFTIHMDSLRTWLECLRVYRQFRLEDVFLTGILTEAAGLSVEHYWTTYGEPVHLLPSLSAGQKAGEHLFFTEAHVQPISVWSSVFQRALSESLRLSGLPDIHQLDHFIMCDQGKVSFLRTAGDCCQRDWHNQGLFGHEKGRLAELMKNM
ncbi:unnamed protein product [Calicophoron daubneyi]|uniref:Hexosyltransferase n=1 Tax=Calicophoron daubneyi TaxID=300641 RepID=A0AAV2TFR3_CALDB